MTYQANVVVPNLYEETKAQVVKKLNNAVFVSIKSDGWTSRATESYETITAHFINENWELSNHVLQTRVLGLAHTGHNIAEVLKSAVSSWNLKKNGLAPSITTDNASNVVNAVKEAELFPHIRCFAHTLNLATQKGLQVPQMDRLLGRVNRIVVFFPQK